MMRLGGGDNFSDTGGFSDGDLKNVWRVLPVAEILVADDGATNGGTLIVVTSPESSGEQSGVPDGRNSDFKTQIRATTRIPNPNLHGLTANEQATVLSELGIGTMYRPSPSSELGTFKGIDSIPEEQRRGVVHRRISRYRNRIDRMRQQVSRRLAKEAS